MDRCADCGKELPPEFRHVPDKPCPQCKSKARVLELKIEDNLGGSDDRHWNQDRPGVQSKAQLTDQGKLDRVVRTGGLFDCPVIAVPPSIGVSAAFSGLATLLTMLNACSANVVAVNIDSGFKGGYVAALIARRAARASAPPSLSSEQRQ